MINRPGLALHYDCGIGGDYPRYIYITRNHLSEKWVLPYNGQEKDSLRAVIQDWMGYMTSAEQIKMVSAGLEISTGGRLWKLAWPRKGVTA